MAGLTVAASGAKTYRGRRAQRSLLYRTVQTHFETWLALRGGELNDADPVPDYVEREFRRYLECGILAHGFARAHCAQCGHDFLIAFSCKGRGVCPSCNTRRARSSTTSRSEEHTSELQSRGHLVCRLLLEKKKYVYS